MSDDNAYFLPVRPARSVDGVRTETLRATGLTVGTWWPGIQHGGAPTGLLTRAIANHDGGEDRMLVRLTVDILGPIPVTELTAVSYTLKPGRHTELIGAELTIAGKDGEKTVARATGLRYSRADSSEIVAREPNPFPPVDEIDPEPNLFPDSYHVGFTGTVDFRIIESLFSPRPTAAWIRTETPLVAGEKMSPLEQVGTLADVANGMSTRVDPREWTFMNTDLTLHLIAPPREPWLAMTSGSSIGPDGRGICAATIYDSGGLLGHITQSQFIRPRETVAGPGST